MRLDGLCPRHTFNYATPAPSTVLPGYLGRPLQLKWGNNSRGWSDAAGDLSVVGVEVACMTLSSVLGVILF